MSSYGVTSPQWVMKPREQLQPHIATLNVVYSESLTIFPGSYTCINGTTRNWSTIDCNLHHELKYTSKRIQQLIIIKLNFRRRNHSHILNDLAVLCFCKYSLLLFANLPYAWGKVLSDTLENTQAFKTDFKEIVGNKITLLTSCITAMPLDLL